MNSSGMPSQASQVVECVRWGRVGESPEKCEAAVSCMDVSCVVVPSQVEVYTLQCARRDLHCTLRSCHVRCAGPPPRAQTFFDRNVSILHCKDGAFSQPNDHPVPDDENT